MIYTTFSEPEWVPYKQNEMLNILLRNMDQYCFKQQAEIKYIEAIGKRSRGEKYMDELIQSIELCDSIVRHIMNCCIYGIIR